MAANAMLATFGVRFQLTVDVHLHSFAFLPGDENILPFPHGNRNLQTKLMISNG